MVMDYIFPEFEFLEELMSHMAILKAEGELKARDQNHLNVFSSSGLVIGDHCQLEPQHGYELEHHHMASSLVS
jgi:hypothetical protein